MDFPPSTRHTVPDGAGPSWFRVALAEVRRVRVGDVAIELELLGGGTVNGYLDEVKTSDRTEFGTVILESENDRFEFDCENLAAFMLLDDEPPLDRSDELRSSD